MNERELPEYLVEGDGHIDITLSKPATFDGADLKVVRMREPTAGDLEAFHGMKGTEATREIQTFANLCELSPEGIRKMRAKDYKRMQEAFTVFMG